MGKNYEVPEEDIIETHYSYFGFDNELDKMFQETYARLDKERYQYVQRNEEIKNKTKYIFLTINPNPNITLMEFIRCMEKLMSKQWMTRYLYVFEQRGETEADVGKGFHFHAIIEKPTNKSYQHMMRELASSANKMCDTSNFHFYNVKNISEEEKNRKVEYITGRKADIAKHLKQDMDIIFRTKNNLLSYYNIGIV